ncbi:MAG TPA: serine protease [Solirubrobacteraceae bacterium]
MLASAAALVVAAACCAPAQAIIGGAPVSLTEHPYQVALIQNSQGSATNGQYCGGSIRDPLHIITAAHCVFDTPFSGSGQPAAPSQIDVLAGTESLAAEATGQRVHASAVSVDPSYFEPNFEHDAALITLATPLALGAKKQPVELIDDVDWAPLPPGAALFVSGWGTTTAPPATPSYPDQLRGVTVNFITDQDCQDNYLFGTTAPDVQVCAAAPGRDACKGDSGGPLVRTIGPSPPADDRLVGIVSSGVGCAQQNAPGIYTEVAEPAIRSFLIQGLPVPAPANRSAPTLSGIAAVGQHLTCSRGVWTGSPSFAYQFVRSTAAGDVGIAANGASADYVVTTDDAGTSLRCIVFATNPGGTSIAETARTGVVPGALVQRPSRASLDKNAPVAKVVRARCTATRCTLTVTVTDAGFSAGIKTVRATVRSTYRTTCTRKGRRVACTKSKTKKATVKKLAARKFKVVASKLPIGKQLFVLYAVDKANHRQRLPTKKTLRTRRAKRR